MIETLLAAGMDWDRLGPTYWQALVDTLFMVSITMLCLLYTSPSPRDS